MNADLYIIATWIPSLESGLGEDIAMTRSRNERSPFTANGTPTRPLDQHWSSFNFLIYSTIISPTTKTSPRAYSSLTVV